MKNAIFLSVFILGCASGEPPPAPELKIKNVKLGSATLTVKNETSASAVVNITFGSDSKVLASDWKFCAATGNLNCEFQLGSEASQILPLSGKYLNATITFNGKDSCGSTKAELNMNNPAWFDILDVSLVDGYSNKIKIMAGDVQLGPPNGKDGNEKVVGLFPYGCDICTAREKPPCGIPAGGSGCKSGSQYKPDVICQWQGSVKGGGTPTVISLVE